MATHVERYVTVKFQREFIHRYPEAGTNPELADVSFLQYPHRHMLHFKVTIQVFNDNRDIEFIQLKRKCTDMFDSKIIEADYKSCEMISDELYGKLSEIYGSDRTYQISVFEDDENGSETMYVPYSDPDVQ